MPGQGRHGKRTPWWVFGLHLGLVFGFTLGMMLAFSEGIVWLGIMAGMAWLSSFVLTAMDNVSLPLVKRMWVRLGKLWQRVKTRAVDKLRKMGKTRKTKEKGEQ